MKTWLELHGRSVDQNTSLCVSVLLILFPALSASHIASSFRKNLVLAARSQFHQKEIYRGGQLTVQLSLHPTPLHNTMGHTI